MKNLAKEQRQSALTAIAMGGVLSLGLVLATGRLAQSQETPECNGKKANIYVFGGVIVGGPDSGKPYRGLLRGTPGDDVILGTAADDMVMGYGGNDTLCAGPGSDQVQSGPEDDLLEEPGSQFAPTRSSRGSY